MLCLCSNDNFFTFLHRTKKLLARSTSVGSYLIKFPYANIADLDLGLLCLQKGQKVSLLGKGLKSISTDAVEELGSTRLTLEPVIDQRPKMK